MESAVFSFSSSPFADLRCIKITQKVVVQKIVERRSIGSSRLRPNNPIFLFDKVLAWEETCQPLCNCLALELFLGARLMHGSNLFEHACVLDRIRIFKVDPHNDAAASIMPVLLNAQGLVTTTCTGYFQVMNFVQPGRREL